jgi:Phosphate-selective porin O and P
MKNTYKLLPLCAALTLGGLLPGAHAQTAQPQSLLQRLEQMSAELERLKNEVSQLRAAQGKTEAAADHATAQASRAETQAAQAAAEAQTATAAVAVASNTVLTGYGEITYNRYPNNLKATQADLRRAVIGIQHRFDDKTKFVGEFEWEHAVTSATDRGEAAVEQAYIEHQLNDKLAVRAGLFLIPLGMLNENHEPNAFYGVNRNFVETAIIPSTWREGGVMFIGTTDAGVTWKAGVSTGFDLSKWDSTSTDGKNSPLGSVHQEMQLAKARDLSAFGALDWRGYPGLLLGGGVFTGQAGHGALTDDVNPRVTVWDLHARWTPGKWDLAAVYAAGSITGASALNVPFAADTTPIPSAFDGAYVQAAYKLWSQGNYQLKPFARIERFNTAKAYEAFPAGLGRAADSYEQVTTVGANFHLSKNVVIKGDYQTFLLNSSNNRLNLGLGWSF